MSPISDYCPYILNWIANALHISLLFTYKYIDCYVLCRYNFKLTDRSVNTTGKQYHIY